MTRAHEAKGVFYWFGNSLLNLALKRNTEEESEFHSLAVRIIKNDAKPFVRTDGMEHYLYKSENVLLAWKSAARKKMEELDYIIPVQILHKLWVDRK